VDVYFRCAQCDHAQADHGTPCGADRKGEPCTCGAFHGLLEDGKPIAIRMRMLSNLEWSTVLKGASIPARLAPGQAPDAPTAEAVFDRHKWARAVVTLATTAMRRVEQGQEVWVPIEVVERYDEITDPTRQVSIEQLDRGGSTLVSALALALSNDFNDGGPFRGVVRNFRSDGASDVLRSSVRVRADASRADAEPLGQAGGNVAPGAPGAGPAVHAGGG
jgi:hypothetical protein